MTKKVIYVYEIICIIVLSVIEICADARQYKKARGGKCDTKKRF